MKWLLLILAVLFIASHFTAETPKVGGLTTTLASKLAASSTASTFSLIDDVLAAESAYQAKNGKYLSVINGATLDQKFVGKTPADFLGKNLPPTFYIVEYETADHQVGFDIVQVTDTEEISVGIVGPQAAQRTYTRARVKGATPSNGL